MYPMSISQTRPFSMHWRGQGLLRAIKSEMKSHERDRGHEASRAASLLFRIANCSCVYNRKMDGRTDGMAGDKRQLKILSWVGGCWVEWGHASLLRGCEAGFNRSRMIFSPHSVHLTILLTTAGIQDNGVSVISLLAAC